MKIFSRFALFWETIVKICSFLRKNMQEFAFFKEKLAKYALLGGKKYQNQLFLGKNFSPLIFFPSPPTSFWKNINLCGWEVQTQMWINPPFYLNPSLKETFI